MKKYVISLMLSIGVVTSGFAKTNSTMSQFNNLSTSVLVEKLKKSINVENIKKKINNKSNHSYKLENIKFEPKKMEYIYNVSLKKEIFEKIRTKKPVMKKLLIISTKKIFNKKSSVINYLIFKDD
jgi:hypothetical protein